MSRSAPEANRTANPASRFFEWSGSDGIIRFYDKAKKENVTVGQKFNFILLDELSTVRGWSDSHDSSLYSNEVRDTKGEVMVVKAHKGGIIAEGFYASIRDKVQASGGKFTASIYIAFKDGGELKLGNLQFAGAALNAWIEFRKANREAIEKEAVGIVGFTEAKKGKVTFRVPKFAIAKITPERNAAAMELDKALQVYLKGYLAKTKTAQVETPPHEPSDNDGGPERDPNWEPDPEPADTSMAESDLAF